MLGGTDRAFLSNALSSSAKLKLLIYFFLFGHLGNSVEQTENSEGWQLGAG